MNARHFDEERSSTGGANAGRYCIQGVEIFKRGSGRAGLWPTLHERPMSLSRLGR